MPLKDPAYLVPCPSVQMKQNLVVSYKSSKSEDQSSELKQTTCVLLVQYWPSYQNPCSPACRSWDEADCLDLQTDAQGFCPDFTFRHQSLFIAMLSSFRTVASSRTRKWKTRLWLVPLLWIQLSWGGGHCISFPFKPETYGDLHGKNLPLAFARGCIVLQTAKQECLLWRPSQE